MFEALALAKAFFDEVLFENIYYYKHDSLLDVIAIVNYTIDIVTLATAMSQDKEALT